MNIRHIPIPDWWPGGQVCGLSSWKYQQSHSDNSLILCCWWLTHFKVTIFLFIILELDPQRLTNKFQNTLKKTYINMENWKFYFRLAIKFCPLELETLMDPSDKIKSRLFAKVSIWAILYFQSMDTIWKRKSNGNKINQVKIFYGQYFTGSTKVYKNQIHSQRD